jgi:hypothetical protein
MDLNYLYHRHGISLMMAEAATSSCARMVHEELARLYAKRIADDCPPADRVTYWTTWQAYMSVPPESPSQPAISLEVEMQS